MPTKRLDSLLNPSVGGELGGIVRRAKAMGDLAEALAAGLPPDEAASIVAANVRDDKELVVVCRSPAWASRLRYESEALLTAARRHGVDASTVTIRVSKS